MAQAAQRRLLTAEDLLELPDDNLRHELVAGRLVSEPPAFYGHGRIAARFFRFLSAFVRERSLGDVVSTETGFILARSPDTLRAPDVAFVSNERLQAAGEIRGFFPGPPDLTVEVLSTDDRPGEVRAKVADYLAAGARLVWVVDPAQHTVTVYPSLLSPSILQETDTLEGGSLLPGFAAPVADFFND